MMWCIFVLTDPGRCVKEWKLKLDAMSHALHASAICREFTQAACAQVCMAIENLYQRVQQVSHIKHSAGIRLLAQAEVVCHYLCDMATAAKLAPAVAAKAALVAAAHGAGGS